MRNLYWLLIFVFASCAWATSYSVTGVRIDGTGTPQCMGNATAASGVITASTGSCFASTQVGNGIVFNGVVYEVTAYSSAVSITVTPTVTQASSVAYSVLQSACYDISIGNDCNGWVMEVDISTVATGGTYTLGFSQASNNRPISAAITIVVSSNGYQGTTNGGTCGSATSYTRTIYATHQLRQPYPHSLTWDEVSSAGTFTTRLALSAPIFSGDTITSISIGAGFYTDGSGNTNSAYSSTVTNNSTLSYSSARTLFNWTLPGWNRISGSSFTVRGTGFAQFPKNNLPIACVVYTATDQHSHTATATVGFPTIDASLGDKAPIVEYIGSITASTFTNGDQITVNFKAYPWIGTSGSIMDSSDGTYAQPTPLYAPEYFLYDGSNVYSAAAYVDGSLTFAGSNTSGTFVAGEKVTQQTSGAIAYLIDTTGANGSGPIHLGQIVSGTLNVSATKTWTGSTSGAVFTESSFTPTYAGSDSNSCAEAESSWPGTQPSPCQTINGAAIKMASYNNSSSTPTHNDACGTMYLAQGYYNWVGSASATPTTTGKCWVTITPTTGLTQSQVVIDQQSGNGNLGGNSWCTTGTSACGPPTHMKNLTINVATGPVSDFNEITYLWMDGISFFDNNGTAPIYKDTIVYWTDSAIPSTVGGNGMAQFSNVNMAPAIIRGNDLTTVIGLVGVPIYTVVGNTNTTSATCFLTNESGSTAPASIMPIVAFNTFYKCAGTSNTTVRTNLTTGSTLGVAYIQNLIEYISATGLVAQFWLSADASTGTPNNNEMIRGNTVVGERMNRAYSDGLANQYNILYRQLWSEVGNIMDQRNIKTDTFSSTNAQSGSRVGNWSAMFQSGSYANVYAELSGGSTGWPASGTDCNDFSGIYTYDTALSGSQTINTPLTCSTNTTINFPIYKNRLAYDGTSGNGGGGDYHLMSSSPAVNAFPSGTNFMPYDLAGQIRNNSGWGSAGAWEQAIIQGTGGTLAF